MYSTVYFQLLRSLTCLTIVFGISCRHLKEWYITLVIRHLLQLSIAFPVNTFNAQFSSRPSSLSFISREIKRKHHAS